MIESLLGTVNKEKILVFLQCREEGYAREIAAFYDIPLTPVINQLKILEAGNVIFSKLQGRTKLYRFNPRYPFLTELRNLLVKVVSFYPENIKKDLQYNRRRPRRSEKPL